MLNHLKPGKSWQSRVKPSYLCCDRTRTTDAPHPATSLCTTKQTNYKNAAVVCLVFSKAFPLEIVSLVCIPQH